MSLDDRYRSETEKWDQIAKKQSQHVEILPPELDFHAFAQRDEEFPGVSEFLGDIRGKQILELGCGAGKMATLLARSGADVTAFDLSPKSVALARTMARANGVEIKALVSAGEHLPFASEAFDIVVGKSILHHLVPEIARHDLYRVLKKDGKMVFVEPLGMNPILTFIRKHVPYPHKAVVGVDRPLTYDDINARTVDARQTRYQEIQFLSMIERGFGWNNNFRLLRKMDESLLRFPLIRRLCRYVVIYSVK